MDTMAKLKSYIKSILLFIPVLVTLILVAAPADTALPAVQVWHGSHLLLKEGTSGDWAGYAVATNLKTPRDQAVSDIKGQWVVPSVSPSTSDTYSAIWVGIDGYNSDTVEQIGTEQDSIDGQPTYSAWFERYPRASHDINNPVSPGDTIMAEVKYIGNDYFQLILNDKSVNLDIHSDWNFDITLRVADAQRQSAEWIIEAPTSLSVESLPLANFGNIKFSDARATLNGHTGTINDRVWQNDAITLVASDATVTAQPSALSKDGSSFGVQAGAIPPITVDSPNGGENWKVGTLQIITWTTNGLTGLVRIDLSRDGGSTWKTIVPYTSNNGHLAWSVTGPATTEGRIRVVSMNNKAVSDISDADFTISLR
jgi:hypothetical protein